MKPDLLLAAPPTVHVCHLPALSLRAGELSRARGTVGIAAAVHRRSPHSATGQIRPRGCHRGVEATYKPHGSIQTQSSQRSLHWLALSLSEARSFRSSHVSLSTWGSRPADGRVIVPLLSRHSKRPRKRFGIKFFDWLMSGSLMSHNFKTIDFTVIFTTNLFVPAISDNTFVSAIIHNTFATIPLSTIPYTGVPRPANLSHSLRRSQLIALPPQLLRCCAAVTDYRMPWV